MCKNMETKCYSMLRDFKPHNFEELYNFITKDRKNMSQEDALTTLIYCCHICIEKTNPISINCLKSVMEIAYSLISSLNEKQLIQYVQAMYHIVKYLSEENFSDTIIEIDKMLWPPFLPSVLSPKLQNIYLNMSKILSNIIARCVKQEYKESILGDSKVLLKICEISRKISSAVSDPLEYLTQSVSSFTNLSKLKISAHHYKDHFISILKQIQVKVDDKNALDLYHPIQTLSGLIVHYILLHSKKDTTYDMFRQIKECASKIFHDNAFIKNLYELLEFPLLLSHPDEEPETIEQLANCHETIKFFLNSDVKEHRQELGNKLQAMLITILNYYKSASGSCKWANFSENLQMQIVKCIYNLSEIESQASIKCSCRCLVTLNTYSSFKTCQIVTTYVELSISKCSLTSAYHESIVAMLPKFADKIIYLRKHHCKNWKIAWNTLGTGVYNLAVQLYKKKNVNALHYFYFFLKHFLIFESNNDDNIIKSTVLSSSLQAVCSLNSKDYTKCMAFSALGIYLCKNQSDYFMPLWITTKHNLKGINDEVQLVTLVQAFQKFSGELSVIIESENFLKKDDMIDLLRFELEQYKLKWKSKIPMMTVLKELVDRIENVEKIVEIIVNTFGDSELIFHDDVLEIARNALKEAQEKCNLNSDLVLGILYFLNYKFRMKKSILKQAEEMEQTSKVNPFKTTAVNKDPNDECDIVSTYENLKLDKYLDNIKYLNTSLGFIEKHFADILKNGDTFGIYHILMHIAFEYRLIGNRLEVIKALHFAVKIAQTIKEPLKIIHSISSLIELSDVRKKPILQLISCADEVIKKIQKSKSTFKIFFSYYVSKAKAFLYSNPKESYRNYRIAQDILNDNNYGDNFCPIGNKLLFLKLKYLSIPCSNLPDLHNENLVDMFIRIPAFYDELTRSSDNAYEISALMETNEAITDFYRRMKCPREVRFYCKDMAVLTQKLVLPLRCCNYLLYLSQADLYSSRLDDCRVKLNGIIDILCFNNAEEYGKDVKTKFDFELECIINNMQDIQLDAYNKNNYKKSSSPIFARHISYPTLCQNGKSCNSCFWCNCYEYRDLLLKKNHLEAMLSLKQNDLNTAKISFNNGLNLHQYYSRIIDTSDDINNAIIYRDFIGQTIKENVHAYGCFLFDFAKFLMNINNKASAELVNEKNLKLLEPFKYRYMDLFRDVVLQKLALITDIPELDCPITSPVEESKEIIKTPEHNQNKVIIPLQKISPCSPIVKVSLKKRLQFEASPEADGSKTVGKHKSVAAKRETSSSSRNGTTCNNKENPAAIRKHRAKLHLPKIKIYSEETQGAAGNKGRTTRAKAVSERREKEKGTELKVQNVHEIKSERRKCSSRKNLLGGPSEKNDQKTS